MFTFTHNNNIVIICCSTILSYMNIAWHQSHNRSNASAATAFVPLEWDSNVNLATTFIVEIMSIELGESPMYYITPNTTLQLPVVYNQEYTVTVLANNCIGNSTPANLSLLISKQSYR